VSARSNCPIGHRQPQLRRAEDRHRRWPPPPVKLTSRRLWLQRVRQQSVNIVARGREKIWERIRDRSGRTGFCYGFSQPRFPSLNTAKFKYWLAHVRTAHTQHGRHNPFWACHLGPYARTPSWPNFLHLVRFGRHSSSRSRHLLPDTVRRLASPRRDSAALGETVVVLLIPTAGGRTPRRRRGTGAPQRPAVGTIP
jgi:hypothetical protein